MRKLLSRCSGIFGALVLILSATILHAGVSLPIKHEKKTIYVGIYAPFSNESAYIGRNMLAAMELARDQLKTSNINYEFYTLDSLSKNSNQIKTVQKFIDAHHITVLLTEGGDTGALVAPIANKNKLIHFCLGADAVLSDGVHNFHMQSPNHKRGAVLTTAIKPEFVAQFKAEYFSHPVTEAGYAYDIFHLINNSAEIALNTHADFSNQTIAKNILALESGTGLMGQFMLDKNGVSYAKKSRVA